jgi:hypothetical protein
MREGRGRLTRDIGEDDEEDEREQGEVGGGQVLVGRGAAPEVEDGAVHAAQLSRDARGIEHCKQGITQPKEWIRYSIKDIQSIEKITRNFDKSPRRTSKQEEY